MQLGMVGLGRMGANLVRRLMRDGHQCVVYDVNPQAVAGLAAEGAVGAPSLDGLGAALIPPRAVWVMVPAALTGDTVDALAARMIRDDVIVAERELAQAA
jgi:6-phosphogluconate dehydrogenase